MTIPTSEQQALIEELRAVYLFAALDDTQLSRVVHDARLVHLGKHETLFEQGDPAQHFFLVRSGQVKLFRISPEGQEKIIELVQPGQVFAEALLFMDDVGGYPVHAEAIDASEVLSFDNRGFKALLSDSVDTCFRLMAAMSRRLHRQINEIDRLTLHNATFRLVSYLLQEVPDDVLASPNVRLTTTKHVIASRLSIQPETFSRILARLHQQGLIDVQGNTVVLRDIDALRKMIQSSETSV